LRIKKINKRKRSSILFLHLRRNLTAVNKRKERAKLLKVKARSYNKTQRTKHSIKSKQHTKKRIYQKTILVAVLKCQRRAKRSPKTNQL